VEIELDIKKSIEDNATEYFDRAKKSKRKLEGAASAIQKFKEKLEKLQNKQETEKEEFEKRKPEKVRKKEWYEKFRWFRSSEGFLCIGGRDATTNDMIVKKHTEEGDIVFHTEAPGSPFFVVKAEGETIGEETIKEVAIATVSYSRAWKLGLTVAEVYYVNPDQLSKTAQAGEYLGRGAFMVRGKRNYSTQPLAISVGIDENGVAMGGPEEAIKKHCKEYVNVIQGRNKPSDVAKKIRSKIGGDLDDIIRALPAGNSEIKE